MQVDLLIGHNNPPRWDQQGGPVEVTEKAVQVRHIYSRRCLVQTDHTLTTKSWYLDEFAICVKDAIGGNSPHGNR